jgi:hypothetical protein
LTNTRLQRKLLQLKEEAFGATMLQSCLQWKLLLVDVY